MIGRFGEISTSPLPPNPDANLDGRINVLDLIVVAQHFGEQPLSNPLADTNKDGVVNLLDLVFVAGHLSQNAAAPSQLAFIESIPSTVKEVIAAQRALTELEAMPNKSPGVQIAIELPPPLPSHRGPKRPRNQTPAQLSQPLQSRYLDTLSAIRRVYSHCQNLRCDRQLGQNNPSRPQADGILSHPRACRLLEWA